MFILKKTVKKVTRELIENLFDRSKKTEYHRGMSNGIKLVQRELLGNSPDFEFIRTPQIARLELRIEELEKDNLRLRTILDIDKK